MKNHKYSVLLIATFLICELWVFAPVFGQTLNQEYKVKQDYKNCKIEINSAETILTICGKSYDIEESYYGLKFAVTKNGDYVCILRGDGTAWQYMDKICLTENRYKVCLRGGLTEYTEEYGMREVHPAIWIVRKR